MATGSNERSVGRFPSVQVVRRPAMRKRAAGKAMRRARSGMRKNIIMHPDGGGRRHSAGGELAPILPGGLQVRSGPEWEYLYTYKVLVRMPVPQRERT